MEPVFGHTSFTLLYKMTVSKRDISEGLIDLIIINLDRTLYIRSK